MFSSKLAAVIIASLALCVPCFGAWTASVDRRDREGFQLRVIVSFTDGSAVISREYRFDGGNIDSDLKTRIQDQLSRLSAIDSEIATLPIGTISKPADPQPTVDDVAREAFLAALRAYNSAKHAADLGLIDPLGPEMTQASADLKNKFKVEYLGLL